MGRGSSQKNERQNKEATKMKLTKFVVVVALSLIAFFGCANKVIPTLKDNPTVVIHPDSDPVPQELIDHIIKRTDGFCKESGRKGVEEVGINHNATKRHTTVVYICINDPKTIGEVGKSDVPFRVVDEELRQLEISYWSSKAVYCAYVDPRGCGIEWRDNE